MPSGINICSRINRYATAVTDCGALIIGGYMGSESISTIACFNREWSKIGDLQSTRRNHRAIVNGEQVYLVGGHENGSEGTIK